MKADPLLVAAIALAEDAGGAEIDITLVTGGFLISGFVISFEKYLKHHAFVEGVAHALTKVATEDGSGDQPRPDASGRNYIHLRDAQYFGAGASAVPESMGVVCRVRLEEVVGFHLGRLALSPAE